jgi:hypothetical protein
MIDDKEPYNKIGRIITKTLPQNWEKVVFHMKVQDEKVNWRTDCYFLGTENVAQEADLLYLNPELLTEIEGLRNTPIFPKVTCDLIFRSDRTYEIKVDRHSIQVKQPDIAEVQHAIRELRALNFDSMEIEDLKEHLSAIIPGYILNSPIIAKDTTLYRGVEWGDKPLKVENLHYPPLSCVKTLHRAGRTGKSLFYCSLSREAPFFELGLIPGARVAISHWKTTTPIVVNNVGYHDEVFGGLGSKRECPSWGKNTEYENFEKTTSIIKLFFATEFAKIVPPGQEHLYKLSIAIAELHFSNDMFGGLLYPSMAIRSNADNLVLKPECVDKHLSLRKVEYIRVDETDDKGFKVSILDFADTFDENGHIKWKGRHPRWVIREKGQALRLAVENGKWVARNEKGEKVEPE